MSVDLRRILLLSDIDGTLVSGGNEIPQRNLDAIRKLEEAGGHFAFATGRSYHVAAELGKILQPKVPCLYLNGAYIYDVQSGTVVSEHFLPDSCRSFVREVYERFPQVAIDLFLPACIGVLRRNRYSSFHEQMGDDIPMRAVTLEDYPPQVYKLLFMADPEIAEQVRELYVQRQPEDTDAFFSNPSFFEIMPKGINKGSGLRELCQILEIPEGNSYAIGDFENDLEMLKAASYSASPENGSDAVKAEADWVVCHCKDGAVADLIEKIMEQRSEN